MKDLFDIIVRKWNDFYEEEKEIIANSYLIKNNTSVKDGDIVVVKFPLDRETGDALMDFDVITQYHNSIKEIFKGCKVITSPLDINIISKHK